MVEKQGGQEWYGNKELFEMFSEFKEEVSELKGEIKETKTLIRDYNGLRETINEAVAEIGKIKTELATGKYSRKEWTGYVIAVITILFSLLNYMGG